MKIIEINGADFDQTKFVQHFWQQQPLLIRSLFSKELALINPEELAGLACEDEIESRIVSEVYAEGKTTWQVENGPFEEDRFQELPDEKWSLLVQSADHWSPDVHELLTSFRFLPAHILDDVMVSFAPQGGGVGPHFDYYDVFLVQGLGSRRWQIGQSCDESTSVSVTSQLLILDDFQEQQSFILETGDVLYLPPKLAHWGTALEDCITYSVGFRTPSVSQSIIAFTDEMTEQLNEKERLLFPVASDPFQINVETISGIKNQLASYLLDEAKLLKWYGCFATEAKNEYSVLALEEPIDQNELMRLLNSGSLIYKNEGSRFIYSENDVTHLFVDGEHYALSNRLKHLAADLAKLLCEKNSYSKSELKDLLADESFTTLLMTLLNNGSLYFEDL